MLHWENYIVKIEGFHLHVIDAVSLFQAAKQMLQHSFVKVPLVCKEATFDGI